MLKIPTSGSADPLTAIVMVQRQATEPYCLVEVETLVEMFLQEMASVLIHMILTTTPLCRCMYSSRAASKGSKDKGSSIRLCNINRSLEQTVQPIRTWQLFITKGQHPQSLKVVFKQ
jgi:hypothetical protein